MKDSLQEGLCSMKIIKVSKIMQLARRHAVSDSVSAVRTTLRAAVGRWHCHLSGCTASSLLMSHHALLSPKVPPDVPTGWNAASGHFQHSVVIRSFLVSSTVTPVHNSAQNCMYHHVTVSQSHQCTIVLRTVCTMTSHYHSHTSAQ
jgi:hypothetical protein